VFTDGADIANYATAAVDWSANNNIVRPVSSGTFAPRSSSTRAQVADALMNFDRIQQPTTTDPTEPDPAPSEDGRVLIAYFSATNKTEGIANHLHTILDADLYEIVPKTPYTSADLNYNTDCRANREQNDPSARPAITGSVENMEQYDIIFLGYPIWWGRLRKSSTPSWRAIISAAKPSFLSVPLAAAASAPAQRTSTLSPAPPLGWTVSGSAAMHLRLPWRAG